MNYQRSLLEQPLTMFRKVTVKTAHALDLERHGVTFDMPGARSAIEYARLDGFLATARKVLTRSRGEGQFAAYQYVEFHALERLVGSSDVDHGRFEGVAIGQLAADDRSVDLLTWQFELTTEDLRTDIHHVEEPPHVRPRARAWYPWRAQACIGIIGAGAFAQNVIVPALHGAGAEVAVVADASLVRARRLGGRLSGSSVAHEPNHVVEQAPELDGVVLACAHSAHRGYAEQLLEAGCPVLVEKPAALDATGLTSLLSTAARTHVPLRVGHNRRYARDFVEMLRAVHRADYATVTLDVEAYAIPGPHWYHAPSEGGRLLGNLTHWIDLAIALAGNLEPLQIDARRTRTGASIHLRFSGLDVLIHFAKVGQRTVRGREMIRIKAPEVSLSLEDWSILSRDEGAGIKRKRRTRDRGHHREYSVWVNSLVSRAEWSDPVRTRLLRELELSHKAAFEVRRQLDDDGIVPNSVEC